MTSISDTPFSPSDREHTLQLLLQMRQVAVDAHGQYRLTSNLVVAVTAIGYCDSVTTDGSDWVATGWAIDFETHLPCQHVLVVQAGRIVRASSFTSAPRGDVSSFFALPQSTLSGVTVSFTPESRACRIQLVGVLSSGALVPFSGPGEYIPPLPASQDRIAVSVDGWAQNFRKPLHRFPQTTPFSDIYSLEASYDPRQYPGVTAQFLEEADVYHQKYTDHRRWTVLLSQAFFRLQMDDTRRVSVLDVGSGSGNSVFAMLTLLPRAEIVATDISPQLLAILYRHLNPADRERVLAVAMDASEPLLTSGSFDLAVGAAILHHILDPAKTIAACYDALRLGGHAIFFEPFEIGYSLLRILYERLLADADVLGLSEPVIAVLNAIVLDITVRTGADKSSDLYRTLDDKWQFTHAYFETEARRLGFSRVQIYPLDPSPQPFTTQLKTHLRLCLGAGPEVVPDSAWEVVRDFEQHFSPASAPQRALEACVILSK